MENQKDIEKLAIDTVRVLAADAVQKANSGHPGTAMALAPMGHVLWTKFLNYNPKTLIGQTATGLSFRQAMLVFYSTTFCI